MPGFDATKLKEIPPKPVHLALQGHAVTLAARQQLRHQNMRPGVERWPVKTGTDEDAAKVDTSGFVKTTVEQLITEPRPLDMLPVTADFIAYQSRRAFGVETTIYQMDVEIIEYKVEADGDYHLVIQGASGQTMIAESPNPNPPFVAAASLWADAIKQVRAALDGRLNPAPAPQMQKATLKATITGVGFFDRVHGQAGVAPRNGIELHPILLIAFPP